MVFHTTGIYLAPHLHEIAHVKQIKTYATKPCYSIRNRSDSLQPQVIKDKHMYVDDIESREEGGTPAIIESIRAGLVFQLKQVAHQLIIEPASMGSQECISLRI